jgi:hypothetical protein
MTQAIFQQGMNGYTSTYDTMLREYRPSQDYGSASRLSVDSQDPAGNVNQILLRFGDLFGTATGQIPLDATITSATLTLETSDLGGGASLHRMLIPWSDSDTYGSLGNGIQADGVEAVSTADQVTGRGALGSHEVDVTESVQAWAKGGANYGWAFLSSNSNGWDFFSSETSHAPALTIDYSVSSTPGETDTTAPTAAINSPAEGTKVSGIITIAADASDNVGVQGVQFQVDSENIVEVDTTAPYTIDLDTNLVSDGVVALSAVVTDLSGNQTTSSPITVTIDNNSSPPPPPPPPSSGTIHVPEDYDTIQEAVNAAGNGDIIIVGPGTYAGGIVISGKSITLASHYHVSGDESLIEQTIISGGAPAIRVDESASNTKIEGFHFIGGNKSVQFFGENGQALHNFFDDTGSDAVSFESASGVARGNHFFSPSDDGIDVDAAAGNILIEDNVFEFAGDDGIEIRNQNYTGPHVTHTIRNNTIVGSSEDGIQIIDYSAVSSRSFVIEQNLIQGSKYAGLGLMDNGETEEDFRAASVPESVHVFNNTFDDNPYAITGGDNLIAVNNIVSNSSVQGLKSIDGKSIVVHTLFFGNAVDQTGSNVDAATTKTGNPLYTSTYGLQPDSPAIDSGTASFVHDEQTVLDIPVQEYNGPAVDLGWREFLL